MLEKSPRPKPRALPGRSELEVELGTKLNYAKTSSAGVSIRVRSPVAILRDGQRVGRARRRPRAGHIDAEILVVEVGMVEGVERFQTELNGVAFTHRDVLEQGHIPILHSAGAKSVSRSPPGGADSGENRVPGPIETKVERDRSILIRAGHASRWEPKTIVKVVRSSGHELRHSAQLIMVGDVREPFRPAKMLGEAGQVIDVVSGEDVRTIPRCRTVIKQGVERILRVLLAARGSQRLRPGIDRTEGQAFAEAALQRDLQRVVIGGAVELEISDLTIALVRYQEGRREVVVAEGAESIEAKARRRIFRLQTRLNVRYDAAGKNRLRWVLIIHTIRILNVLAERSPIRRGIDIARGDDVTRHRADIGQIEGSAPAYFVLNAEAETVYRWHFAVSGSTENITQHSGPEGGLQGREVDNIA